MWSTLGGSLAVFSCALQTQAQDTTRESVSARGDAAAAECQWPAMSPDTRFIGFYSTALNLVPDPIPTGVGQVYLHDRVTGAIELVSRRNDGQPASNGTWGCAISDDGRYVAHVGSVTASDWAIVVRDRVASTTHSMQIGVAGIHVQDTNGGVFGRVAISTTGRFVAFCSSALLVPGDTTVRDVYVHDRDFDADGVFDESGFVKTIKVSVSSAGVAGNSWSLLPHMSPDGRFVVFGSDATNLVPGDTNGVRDVFLHDRDADNDGVFDEPGSISTERINVNSSGDQSSAFASGVSVSSDGRFVVFHSSAADLVADDQNAFSDIFLRDRVAGTTKRVSRSIDGFETDGMCASPQISEDGRFITYISQASNVVANDLNGLESDVVVYDRLNGSAKLVSYTAANVQGDGLIIGTLFQYRNVAISPDGRVVAFLSGAEDMADPASSQINAYVRDRGEDFLFNVDGAGGVNVEDLLDVIGQWGPCPQPPAACAGDINGDGVVNVIDLLGVIGHWS